jgi:hypothetical protein
VLEQMRLNELRGSDKKKELQRDLTAYRRRFTLWFIALNLGWLTLIVTLDMLDLLNVRICLY